MTFSKCPGCIAFYTSWRHGNNGTVVAMTSSLVHSYSLWDILIKLQKNYVSTSKKRTLRIQWVSMIMCRVKECDDDSLSYPWNSRERSLITERFAFSSVVVLIQQLRKLINTLAESSQSVFTKDKIFPPFTTKIRRLSLMEDKR